MNENGSHIRYGLVNVINLFNPEILIIGGGMSAAGERLLQPARKIVAEHALRLSREHCTIVTASLVIVPECLVLHFMPDSGLRMELVFKLKRVNENNYEKGNNYMEKLRKEIETYLPFNEQEEQDQRQFFKTPRTHARSSHQRKRCCPHHSFCMDRKSRPHKSANGIS